MGKGDIKTKRGKITNGSFGVKRPRKKATTIAAIATKPVATKITKEEAPVVKKATSKKKVTE